MCIKVAYASRPYKQLFNSLLLGESDSKDYVRWRIPTYLDIKPFAWIKESVRVLKPGGTMDVIIQEGNCLDAFFCIRTFARWSMSVCPVCKDLHIEVIK